MIRIDRSRVPTLLLVLVLGPAGPAGAQGFARPVPGSGSGLLGQGSDTYDFAAPRAGLGGQAGEGYPGAPIVGVTPGPGGTPRGAAVWQGATPEPARPVSRAWLAARLASLEGSWMQAAFSLRLAVHVETRQTYRPPSQGHLQAAAGALGRAELDLQALRSQALQFLGRPTRALEISYGSLGESRQAWLAATSRKADDLHQNARGFGAEVTLGLAATPPAAGPNWEAEGALVAIDQALEATIQCKIDTEQLAETGDRPFFPVPFPGQYPSAPPARVPAPFAPVPAWRAVP